MRFALVTDLHANWQAWNAVLLDIASSNIDQIICLGDVVGYGPNPREVLESVHAHVHYTILGNHDAVVCGKLDDDLFNDQAQRIIRWTQEQISDDGIDFLSSFPLSLKGDDFRAVHSEFSEPSQFNYIFEAADTVASWAAVPEPLLFIGHNHMAGLFLLGRSFVPRHIAAQDFLLEDDKRFLVSIGSVGQPRDGDARAAYCIYDSDEGSVVWRRLPFDIDAYKAAVVAAGIDPSASRFLDFDPRQSATPLREQVDFSPPESAEKGVRDAIVEQTVDQLVRRVRTWRQLALMLLLLLPVFVAMVYLAVRIYYRDPSAVIANPAPGGGIAVHHGRQGNMLAAPTTAVAAGQPIAGWDVHLADGKQQSIGVAINADDVLSYRLQSLSPGELRLVSPAIPIQPGVKLTLEALFRPDEDFDGSIAAVVSLTYDGEKPSTDDLYLVKSPNLKRKGGWLGLRKTFVLPANAASIQISIRGSFIGAVDVKSVSLLRK